MSVSVFLSFDDAAGEAAARDDGFARAAREGLASAPGLRFIEVSQPAPDDVPAFDDGPPPALLAELNFDDAEDARALLESAALRDALAAAGVTGGITADVFHAVHFPLPDRIKPPPRTAPLSFVVRYHRPVQNEAAFANFYTLHHPPLLAQFPGIRNVLCYLPTGIALPPDLPSSGAFFGNEVVFDDLDSLNRALASEVLPLLKADGKRFPAFGHSTHYAMLRRRVYLRPA